MLGHGAEPSNQNKDEEKTQRQVQEIDVNLHSRHLALYGLETLERIMDSNVLISGMQGLGVEIAKNLILGGVKTVTLQDEGTVELWDLSGSFIFNENDLGRNRALVSAEKLQELNYSVYVSSLSSELILDKLSEFQAVVLTNASLKKAQEVDDYCHNHQPPIPFIKSDVRGLFGQIFCDFGPEFKFFDYELQTKTGIVENITSGYPTLVTCVNDDALSFRNEDMVVFSEVQGMEELNDGKPRKVFYPKRHSFIMEEDSSNFGKYLKGGIATQVNPQKILNFKTLRTALEDRYILFLKSPVNSNSLLIHLAFQTLDKFLCDLNRYPEPGCETDATKFLRMVVEMNSANLRLTETDENIIRFFAFGAKAVLNPMAAIFGGLVAQEVVKACTGKWHPIQQFFYFHSVESLPKEPVDPESFLSINCRYDAQISVFGSTVQTKMEDAKVFLIGCGSVGCELLKNLAMMGVSCGNGEVTCADSDFIESCNLPNHLLFRSRDIGQLKSFVAVPAAASINPSFTVSPRLSLANPCSQTGLSNTFWESLGVVLNAVDDFKSKLYIVQKCIEFGKTHIYSDAVGAICETQVVLPDKHILRVPRDYPHVKEPPGSTVLSFPYKISHCLSWAQSSFDEFFHLAPEAVGLYRRNPSYYPNLLREASDSPVANIAVTVAKAIHSIRHCMENRCKNFHDCVYLARSLFHDYFIKQINKLTLNHPEHALTDDGTPFWSAPKRFPVPLEFSADDITHFEFVKAASMAVADMYEIDVPAWAESRSEMAAVMNSFTIPVSEREEDYPVITDMLMTRIEELARDLPQGSRIKSLWLAERLEPSYYYDLMTGLTNLRARCYAIPEIDKHNVMIILKNIRPSVATSAAIAAGLVCLELYKVLGQTNTAAEFRNSYVNMAHPLFNYGCPNLKRTETEDKN